ncbi:hypothetical protein GCM10023185_42390 [Hymenobacter saemangeumensis]|uniref:Cell division protein FtsL n=1 Tax=Hymenobacter saemangeumensis TaxID=1084522 RepID=A0ABP8IRQ5_9BACT
MALNTPRSNDAPRRANVPRVVAAPEPVAAPVAEPAPEPVAEKVVAEKKKAREPREPKEPAGPRSSWSIFSLLDRLTSVDGLFREGLPVRYLPKLLFVMGLTLLYIGNTHYGNRMNRNIQRLKQETEDLRADYTTLKSDYMEASKQSEVARKVAAFGLVESSSPPFRITVPAGHLDAAELELMPVLTADTLAARAARDSAAAHLADSLAGRRRRSANTPDSGPEIIAPPLETDTSGLAVANALRASAARKATARPAKAASRKPAAPAKARTAKPAAKDAKANKPDSKNSVQKGTNQQKKKQPANQAAKPVKR